MTNTEKLKEYLIGSNGKLGYLLDDNLSNGKVIMLSGAWGSGKTHFWQNEIETSLKKEQKKKKKAYAYISLYGKTNIESVETDLFINAYNSVVGDADIVNKMCSTSLSYGKKLGTVFSSGLNLLTAGQVKPNVKEISKEVENLINNDKFTKAGKFLKDGGIVCFDDFERKSKKIDLNDLFGFITQLTLNFNCKVVIILNSNVFEGKEKEIFTNVKEKSVAKYLMFNPTCDELFEIIFNNNKYINLKSNEEILKNTFREVGIVNARILIQILDNVLEWTKNKNFNSDFYLRYFVISNINFILNHHIFQAQLGGKTIQDVLEYIPIRSLEVEQNQKVNQTNILVKSEVKMDEALLKYIAEEKNINNMINNLTQNISKSENFKGRNTGSNDYGEILVNFINQNKSLVKSCHFLINFGVHEYRESNNKLEVEILNEINTFIETGILI